MRQKFGLFLAAIAIAVTGAISVAASSAPKTTCDRPMCTHPTEDCGSGCCCTEGGGADPCDNFGLEGSRSLDGEAPQCIADPPVMD